jgi:hypothetical protein
MEKVAKFIKKHTKEFVVGLLLVIFTIITFGIFRSKR